MISLFEKYLSEGLTEYAHLVIKNIYNKDIGNKVVLEKYINFLLDNAKKQKGYENKIAYIQEAETVLVYWAENAILDDASMDFFSTYKIRIYSLFDEIKELDMIERRNTYEEKIKKIKKENTELLAKLSKKRADLISTKTEEEFEKILAEVKNLEEHLKIEFLTDRQQKDYENLTKGYTSDIGAKAAYFERNRNKEYNQRAVFHFNYAFQVFIKSEDQYVRDIGLLKGLMDNWLFKYDASKLYSEVIVYYNYIYSYIFNKLDDNGKFEITKLSVNSSKYL